MTMDTIFIGENATLDMYLHTPSKEIRSQEAEKRAAMVICPGGGYVFCSDREADSPALAFLNMGMQVFVLRYSVKENAGNKNPLTELALAVKIVRQNCTQWQVDPDKIAVCGFSAGAHLAANLGVHWDDPEIAERCGVQDTQILRPDAMVLCYPVITAGEHAHQGSIACVSKNYEENIDYWSLEKQVCRQTPPTFLWHTMDDTCVPVENSFLFAAELHRFGVPCECHFYEKGSHGMSTATKEVGAASESIHTWIELCRIWLSTRFGSLPGNAN